MKEKRFLFFFLILKLSHLGSYLLILPFSNDQRNNYIFKFPKFLNKISQKFSDFSEHKIISRFFIFFQEVDTPQAKTNYLQVNIPQWKTLWGMTFFKYAAYIGNFRLMFTASVFIYIGAPFRPVIAEWAFVKWHPVALDTMLLHFSASVKGTSAVVITHIHLARR